ncbi:hypothetical protein PPERSA_11155 [Pseudocohnilembus persalinus]|uniref:Autophagy-related protein 101 n=1 Tax=Pseudocohnilembus persalinus TaxID=266149 RepID=A0A0V0QZB8_PSEPJ|nr:hypothetical protein PPERSA_11155 [Pseudocohnilembus persalinus]|eukprot:KRX07606.1 hypothetical protein PPERSA_11155 [Pseudocohnilembus persalinus]
MVSVLHKLESVKIQKLFVKDVLQALMNTIIFHRALGPIYINYVNCERLEKLTYMKCGDPKVDKDINEFVNNILLTSGNTQNKEIEGQIKIEFINEEKQGLWQIISGKHKSEKIFETWVIPLKIFNTLEEYDEVNYQLQIKQFRSC